MPNSVPATDPGLPTIPETPVMRLYRRHQALVAASEASVISDEAEQDRLFWDEINDICGQLNETPSTCAADFAAKVIVATAAGRNCPDWDKDPLWAEARALVGGAA